MIYIITCLSLLICWCIILNRKNKKLVQQSSSSPNFDTDLDLMAKVAAIRMQDHHIVEEVCRSNEGVYCLMCIQKVYPNTWTVLDNGTYYCPKHKAELNERFKQK